MHKYIYYVGQRVCSVLLGNEQRLNCRWLMCDCRCSLWSLLQAEQSQLASVSVPLLVHCVTLPTGPDVFWRLVEDEFNKDDWRQRFAAVERVTVLARILKPETIRKNQPIMTSLSHAFCCLIGSLNDINSRVVQRTTIYLETIKDSAIKVGTA